MSIRKTMYLTVMLMILVPFFLFSFFVSRVYNERLENLAEDSLQAVANAQITEMTAFCEQQMDMLMSMGGTEVLHAALRGELDDDTLHYVNDMLASRVDREGYLMSSALIDTGGRVVACSEPTYEQQAQQGFEDLKDTVQGEDRFYISNVLTATVGQQQREAVIAIGRVTENEETLGYLLVEISLDFYTSIRKNSLDWNESTFYLLDGNGQIISAGTAEDDRDAFITTREERADYNEKYNAIDLEKQPEGSFIYKVRGKRYITYYSNIEYTKWQILLTVALDDYLAARRIQYTLVWFVLVLCVLAAVWIARFTSRRIMKPVQAISDTLHRVKKQQDYSLRVPEGRRDELGRLAAEVNGLLEYIQTENLDLARRQRLLETRAEQDPLTKLMNRACIEKYLADAMERCRAEQRPLAVVFMDVDDFKAFNTRYGHSVGDQVLQFCAGVLTRETNGVVGRLGGDEFLIVLEDAKELSCLGACLERVKTRLESGFTLRGGGQTPIYCCIGAITVADADAELADASAQVLIDRADALMYWVKNHGKRGYEIEPFDKKP